MNKENCKSCRFFVHWVKADWRVQEEHKDVKNEDLSSLPYCKLIKGFEIGECIKEIITLDDILEIICKIIPIAFKRSEPVTFGSMPLDYHAYNKSLQSLLTGMRRSHERADRG